MTVTELIAAEIRAELARQKRTQKDLAEAIHISEVGVSRRLSGVTPLDVNEVYAIAEWLGVPVEQFLAAERSA